MQPIGKELKSGSLAVSKEVSIDSFTIAHKHGDFRAAQM
jgi:hypothetical protein